MSYVILINDEAKLDLKETRDYYREISDSLIGKFDKEIVKTIDSLAINPEHHQIRYRNIRVVFTNQFSFGIHFIIEENTVYIQRILHEKRLYK